MDRLLKAGVRKTSFKNKSDERGNYLSFTRDETKKDGTAGKPYKVIDCQNNSWPDNKKIGNGSTLNVAVALSERQYKGEKFLKPQAVAIQVWDHIPFGDTGFPTKEHSETVPESFNTEQATGESSW